MASPPDAPAPGADRQLASLAERARAQLRARMRATRCALGSAAVAARSERIVAAVLELPRVQKARSIGLFWPRAAHGEVDMRPLDRELESRGVARYYPFMDPKGAGFSTGFRRIQSVAELKARGRGFAEPPPDASTARRGDIDVLLVPALAATPGGHRLGFGSGFYDVTLPELRPPAFAVIVAYTFQMLGEIPTLEHDVACDMVVTDREIYHSASLIGVG